MVIIKRAFDIIFSAIGLIILAPVLLLIAILIKLDSKGPVLFIQGRVGKNNKDFNIYKFRTMRIQSEKGGLLTLGNNDSRITKIGYFLRRYKIDEFPQLINILKGDMSFVGPRPELRYYVNFYNEDDMKIFQVRPGITGLASLKYRNEVELLKAAKDPEAFFIETIIPDKLKFNKEYIKRRNFFFDLKLIALTVVKVVTK
nr:sugar transferase [Tamlana crocina]